MEASVDMVSSQFGGYVGALDPKTGLLILHAIFVPAVPLLCLGFTEFLA